MARRAAISAAPPVEQRSAPASSQGRRNYEDLGKELGKGTYSSVRLAVSPEGRRVAIKVLTTGRQHDNASNARDVRIEDLREVRILRALAQAPHVVQLLDAFTGVKGSLPEHTLVFPVAFATLKRFMADAGDELDSPLPPGLARQWSLEVAEGMAHVHGCGIIHRDLKPANVLLYLDRAAAASATQTALPLTAKVCDFGLARWLPNTGEPEAKRRRLVAKGRTGPAACCMTARVMTSWYRAPEVLAYTCDEDLAEFPTTAHYGLPADVWSYGAVLYEMIVGKPLARSETISGLVKCLLGAMGLSPDARLAYVQTATWQRTFRAAGELPSRRPPMPSAAEGGPLWGVVARCLQWDPQQRAHFRSLVPCLQELTACTPGTGASALGRPELTASTPGEARDAAPVGIHKGDPLEAVCVEQLLRRGGEPVVAQTKTKKGCQCSGHCRIFAHRRDQVCQSYEVVVGTNFCKQCVCQVDGCIRPQRKWGVCSAHAKMLKPAPPALRVAVRAVASVPDLVPADLVDFLGYFESIFGDVAFSIGVALLKDIPSTAAAMKVRTGCLGAIPTAGQFVLSDAQLNEAMVAAARAAVDLPNKSAEYEQLHRQGVGRFMGSCRTCQDWGVVRKLLKGSTVSPGAEALALGGGKELYELTRDATKVTALWQAVENLRQEGTLPMPASRPPASGQTPAQELVAYGRKLRAALRIIGDRTGVIATKTGDYVLDFLVRKHVLGVQMLWQMTCFSDVATQDLAATWGWDKLPRVELISLEPDQKQLMSALPEDWSCATMSSFVCGRPHWPLLASMFGCLWKEAADKLGEPATYKALDSPTWPEHLRAYRAKAGCCPHPWIAVRSLDFKS